MSPFDDKMQHMSPNGDNSCQLFKLPPVLVRGDPTWAGLLQGWRSSWSATGPLYVAPGSSQLDGHCHIRLGVIAGSRGQSALGRLAYQSCAQFNDGKRRGDYRQYFETHGGTIVLLPSGADPQFADQYNLLMATIYREVRKDAQHGRTIDFSLPRAIPRPLLLPVAAFACAPLAKLGMAMQIDIEWPHASDGKSHVHGHVFVFQRALESDGFGLKVREWNWLFWRDRGRYIRSVIAGRITMACALIGVAAYVDPRRNDERGLNSREFRINPIYWRKHERGEFVPRIEALKKARKNRHANSALDKLLQNEATAADFVTIKSGVSAKHDDVARLRSIELVASKLTSFGPLANLIADGKSKLEFSVDDLLMRFDGDKFSIKGGIASRHARAIVELVRVLGWPTMVVEGSPQSADEIIEVGVPAGIPVINRHASQEVLRKMREEHGYMLLDQIRPHDPLGVAEKAVVTYAQLERDEKETFASGNDGALVGGNRLLAVLAAALSPGASRPRPDEIRLGRSCPSPARNRRSAAPTSRRPSSPSRRSTTPGGLDVGGKKLKIDLKLLDDTSDASKSAQLIEQLIAQQKVHAVSAATARSSSGQSLVPERYGVPFVAGGAGATSIYGRSKWVFGTLPPSRTSRPRRWSSCDLVRRKAEERPQDRPRRREHGAREGLPEGSRDYVKAHPASSRSSSTRASSCSARLQAAPHPRPGREGRPLHGRRPPRGLHLDAADLHPDGPLP